MLFTFPSAENVIQSSALVNVECAIWIKANLYTVQSHGSKDSVNCSNFKNGCSETNGHVTLAYQTSWQVLQIYTHAYAHNRIHTHFLAFTHIYIHT